jgi:hypothetical protein
MLRPYNPYILNLDIFVRNNRYSVYATAMASGVTVSTALAS